MSLDDRTTSKYLAGFRQAVRTLMGPHPGGWSATYNDADALEQALRKAYQAGLLDGMRTGLRWLGHRSPPAGLLLLPPPPPPLC